MRNAIATAALLVAGCTTVTADPSQPPVPGDASEYACKSDGLEVFVGREPTTELGSEILAKSGAKVLRWLQPGQIITMEFRFDRVNAHIGANNRIERVNCG